MIRRPPRSTLDRSSAASDVYKRQGEELLKKFIEKLEDVSKVESPIKLEGRNMATILAVSYTHLRAHETVLDLVCRLLLEKKNYRNVIYHYILNRHYIM